MSSSSKFNGTKAEVVTNKTIAVDLMGGDRGPATIIKAVEAVSVRVPSVQFLLVGDRAVVEPILSSAKVPSSRYELMHAPVTISMDQSAMAEVRRRPPTSSMGCAVHAVHEGKADAVVSCGNTGALFAIATTVLKTVPGIERPAGAGFWPTVHGECVMLDMGVNTEQSSRILIQNAVAGATLARVILDRSRPRVGLLNIGIESTKGLDFIKEASEILDKSSGLGFEYHGFVEPDAVSKGTVDVVVCDGFTGNIMLKASEGAINFVSQVLRTALRSSFTGRIGGLLAGGAFARARGVIDPRSRGGAMLVGLNGLVVKSHGGGDAVAFAAALELACDLVIHGAVDRVAKDLASVGTGLAGSKAGSQYQGGAKRTSIAQQLSAAG